MKTTAGGLLLGLAPTLSAQTMQERLGQTWASTSR